MLAITLLLSTCLVSQSTTSAGAVHSRISVAAARSETSESRQAAFMVQVQAWNDTTDPKAIEGELKAVKARLARLPASTKGRVNKTFAVRWEQLKRDFNWCKPTEACKTRFEVVTWKNAIAEEMKGKK